MRDGHDLLTQKRATLIRSQTTNSKPSSVWGAPKRGGPGGSSNLYKIGQRWSLRTENQLGKRIRNMENIAAKNSQW